MEEQHAQRIEALKSFLITGFLSICCSFFLFPGTMTGDKLLAPLDIPFTLFSRYTDDLPEDFNRSIPRNHYIIDQIAYDVPMQYLAHQAFQAGEFPWWTPYSFGGRPLAADAHVSVFDPIRILLFKCLPFVAAYNWTRIVHSLFTALGILGLLNYLYPQKYTVNILFALLYQTCGPYALYIGHPWIQASTLWLPWLWWGLLLIRSRASAMWGSLLLTASSALFLLGSNLQSYAYLPFFLLCMTIGYAPSIRNRFRYCCIVGLSLTAGILLSSVAWLHVIELYLHASRSPASDYSIKALLAGPLSFFSAPIPWILGTHQTPDLSKLTGAYGVKTALGFQLFCGTTVGVMATIAAWNSVRMRTKSSPEVRTGLALVIGYLLIISTPPGLLLYTRLAPLGCLGIIVLARHFISSSPEIRLSTPFVKVLYFLLAAGIGFSAICSLIPFLPPQVMDGFETSYLNMTGPFAGPTDPERLLRVAQIQQIPAALGLRSPQTLCLILLFMLIIFSRKSILLQQKLPGIFVGISLVQTMLFTSRFVESQPVNWWDHLLEMPLQNQVAQQLSGYPFRLDEADLDMHHSIYPFELEAIYGCKTNQGYAALRPDYISPTPIPGASVIPNFPDADLVPMIQTSEALPMANVTTGRFWFDEIEISSSIPIEKSFDSPYPGRSIFSPLPNTMISRYVPRWLAMGKWLAITGSILFAGTVTWTRARHHIA